MSGLRKLLGMTIGVDRKNVLNLEWIILGQGRDVRVG
jgi:hypothetical protein